MLCAGLALFAAGGACAATVAPGSASSCSRRPATPSSGGSAAPTFVPSGATQLLLCRYHFSRLQGRGLTVRRSRIARLTREFNDLRPMPAGTYSCPADFGVLVTARFVYPGAAPETLQVDATGCTAVTNGRIHRWAFYPPGPRLLDQLLSATGCRARRLSAGCR